MKNIPASAKFWFTNSRPHALLQSALPVFLSLCLAYRHDGFSPLCALLAVFGVACGHCAINLFDDYFDYKKSSSGYRDEMSRAGMRARIAKCAYLTSGRTDLQHLLRASLIFSFLALVCGALIFLRRGEAIPLLAVISGILGVSYSGGPLKLSYRGLGELQAGLMFGPLLMAGVYYSACGRLDGLVILLSIPVGLLVANILYVHSIMDFGPDQKIGKLTLAGLLNKRSSILAVLAILLFTPYLLLAAGLGLDLLPASFALPFLTLPLALALFHSLGRFASAPEEPRTRRFWMGPMRNWEKYKTLGIDWFMIRWFMARNLLMFFCLLIILANFLAS
jgi:1,4-dihydroxy-2-naphthoate octaprenyltransferase